MIKFRYFYDKESQLMAVVIDEKGKSPREVKKKTVHCVASCITDWQDNGRVKVSMVGSCEKLIETEDTVVLI